MDVVITQEKCTGCGACARDCLRGLLVVEEGRARVKVLRSHDKWYGVTYQEDKPAVMAALADKTARGLYPDELWG